MGCRAPIPLGSHVVLPRNGRKSLDVRGTPSAHISSDAGPSRALGAFVLVPVNLVVMLGGTERWLSHQTTSSMPDDADAQRPWPATTWPWAARANGHALAMARPAPRAPCPAPGARLDYGIRRFFVLKVRNKKNWGLPDMLF